VLDPSAARTPSAQRPSEGDRPVTPPPATVSAIALLPRPTCDNPARPTDGDPVQPETAAASVAHVLHLPSPRGLVRHALPSLLESTIGPAVIFYVVLSLAGFRGALLAALAWSYLAAGRRLVRHQRLPGMLVLGVLLLTVRTAISFATGSAFVYFVQPAIGTFAVAVLFVVTAVVRRPIIERLAHDFCPLDATVMARPHVKAFFRRISVLWALVLTTNVAFGMLLLLETSLRAFVVERTALSVGLIGIGVVVSTLWFVRTMRRAGVVVRWSGLVASAV
jgi:intracellular septation protein A